MKDRLYVFHVILGKGSSDYILCPISELEVRFNSSMAFYRWLQRVNRDLRSSGLAFVEKVSFNSQLSMLF